MALAMAAANEWKYKVFQFEISMNVLVSSFRSSEYLCYMSTAIINILILSVRGSTLDVRFWRLKTVPALKGLKQKRDLYVHLKRHAQV